VDEVIDETLEIGKKVIIEFNDIAYIEFIISIDVKASSCYVAFNIIRGSKTKDYPDVSGAISWETFKIKYENISAPSMVKLENQFREISLKKGQDPEVRITELEDLCVKLENIGSCMPENQFMIHLLNNLTSDYDLQVALIERRVGNADKLITVEEVRENLNLRSERLNMKTSRTRKVNFGKSKLYSVGNLKENVKIVVKLGTSHFSARIV
jgi:hypothetical protein